jgi:transcriptional regulator with XRE-family HTH domain
MAGGAETTNEPESSESLRAFGALVQHFRKRRGVSQEQFAPLVQYGPDMVASIEQGRRFPSAVFIERADTVLEAYGAPKTVGAHLTRRPGLARWFQEWAKLEAEARILWTYECRVIPGLLQTEPYARALFENRVPPLSDEQIETQLRDRVDRQRLLHERPNTEYSFILEEALFLRQLGGPKVTRDLIDHVIACAELRNVEVKLMPLRQSDHAGDGGPIRVLKNPDHKWLAYAEGQLHGQLISDSEAVGTMLQRYAKMRSQALTPEDSLSLLKRLRDELGER